MKIKFNHFAAALLVAAVGSLSSAYAQQPSLQYFRPYDQRGLNVFETPKEDTVAYEGFKLRVGANFTQQFQSISHSTRALPKMNENGQNLNALKEIGPGFNLATANLNLDAQLADGIRVSLVTYLSSRHHQETWVKGGFLQVDKLEMLNNDVINKIMERVTIRAGHMEINYGDAHFRRSDNGNALYNPLVGNLIMDAFTTEIGGELYYQHPSGILAMASVTGGEIQGGIEKVAGKKRAPSFIGKLGYDRQLSEDLRVRLTGSVYTTSNSIRNTLYGGDRAGSRYYYVMENFAATTKDNFTSGLLNPGFTNQVTAIMINPFVKFGGLELFGTYEIAKGNAQIPENGTLLTTPDREFTQIAAEALYRLPFYDNVYIAGRYNKVSGELTPTTKVGIDRIQAGLGWFLTKNVLLKGEWVQQEYSQGFAENDIRHGGKFKGVVVEGVIGF